MRTQLSELLKPDKKEWIVWNNVTNQYSVTATWRKEFIEREFGDNTHGGKIYRWTQELEDKLIK